MEALQSVGLTRQLLVRVPGGYMARTGIEFFFFQAEDGIRDLTVTGVQTCALPISGVAVASSVLDADPDDDEWLRQINFDGVVNGTRAFLPILAEQDDGVIVNTSSVFGLAGMPHQSAYCASKFAVRGFTDSLRQELRGTGVRAVTVHPGGIRTNIARNARVRKDPEGRGRSHEQMAAEFEALLRTTPDRAAEIICRGVERGKARILVGPDAYVFDALARVAPTHYYDVLAVLEKRLRAGSR